MSDMKVKELCSKARWQQLMKSLSIPSDNDEFIRLQAAYSESHRAYHTLQHLSECMEKLDWVRSVSSIEKDALIEIALWYHDAIYQSKSKDNERKSAEWAQRFLNNAGLSSNDSEFVTSLIMATRHGEQPNELAHQWIVDIDLAILGAESERFNEYEKQVREEYKWVPWFIYRKKRAVVLARFLQAPSIYNTALFIDRFEQQARDNIERSIFSLEKPGYFKRLNNE